MNPWTGGLGWTIYVDGATNDDSAALTAMGGDVYDRTGTAADVHITLVETDVWDVRITAKQAIVGVWIPWMPTKFSTLTGAFYTSRLLGMRIDMGLAITAGRSWATNDFEWRGDYDPTTPNYYFPGDYCFPGIGYDDGTTATWCGLLSNSTTIQTTYSRGRLALVTQAMPNGAVTTWRVYIGQTTTGIQRARIASLVEIHGQKTTRPTEPMGTEWQDKSGFMDVQTQNEDDPEEAARDFWDRYSDRIPAMLAWGQMSNVIPTEGEETGCCLAKNALHPRNRWMRIFSLEVQREGGLFGVYARPLDADGEDPLSAESWLRCNSRWCNAVYADTIGSLTTAATLAYRNLLIERYSLAYPQPALISGSLAGGGPAACVTDYPGRDDDYCDEITSASKQATATGSSYTTTDPGESRPNDEAYETPWVKTVAWLGRVFMDATPSADILPVRAFIGVQNSDINYPDWTYSSAFVMGCGLAIRDPAVANLADGTYSQDLIDAILEEWESTDFWNSGWRFRDRIGITSIPTGVDVRRFDNEDGDVMLAVDQYSIDGSTVAVTVDGTPISVPMTGRVKLYQIP